MDFKDYRLLLEKDRSYRRFEENRRIGQEDLRSLAELPRYCASGRNLQPVRIRIVNGGEECEWLFPLLTWAGYYTDWAGPEAGERPAAYLVVCTDGRLAESAPCDCGLAMQAITLGAMSMGLGACIIMSFNHDKVKTLLNLPEEIIPHYVIALGYPREKVNIVEMKDGDIKYFRNEKDEHCVPKRSADEIIM